MRKLSRVIVIAAVVCALGHAGLVEADEVPVISAIPVQWLVVGEPFTYDVEATGDPAPTFSLTSYPNGMTIDSDSGVITWTPSAEQMGSRGVRVKATNSAGSVELWFSANVMAEAVEFPVLEPIPDQTFRANTGVWTYTLKATGSPTPQYALNSVPINMELNIVTGVLTWRPNALDAGEHTVIVSAGNILGDDLQTFTFTVLPALYTVQISSMAGGSVTRPGEGTFQCEYGEYLEIEATPDEGYLFAKWTGSFMDPVNFVEAMQPTQTVCVTENETVVANFRATTGQTHTLTASAGDGGAVWMPGEGSFSYVDGTAVVVLAANDPDWRFLNWTGSAVDAGKVANSVDNFTCVIMNGDYTLRANFVPVGSVAQYHLMVQVTAGGDTDPMGGDHLYYAGSTVPLHAYPMEGYEFSGWTGPAVDAGKVADPTSADTTLIMDADHTVTANFVEEGATPVVRHTLTVSAGDGGSVTKPGEGAFQYNENAVVSINAQADGGYQFAGWNGTAVDAGKVANPASRSTTVTMSADFTLTANFELRTGPVVQRQLTITHTTGGSVPKPGTGVNIFDDDQVVAIVAKPDVAYDFVNWTGSAVDAGKVADPTAASTTVTMDSNYNLCAHFTPADPSKVSVQVVSPNGGESLASGRTVSIRWKARGAVPGLSVELSTDGGSTWTQIVYCAGSGDGSHDWVVPTVDSDSCLIRITVEAYSSVLDTSDAPFSIHTVASRMWYVDAAAKGSKSGASWASAMVCLQDALKASGPGDSILVAEGLYWPDLGGNSRQKDRAAAFRLKTGVSVYGGFPAGGGDWARRNPAVHRSVLTGDIGVVGTRDDNSYHVVVADGVDKTAVLDGCAICDGFANGTDVDNLGGGLHSQAGSPLIRNCTFAHNSAGNGGGACLIGGGASFVNCVFTGNTASYCGGGLYNEGDATVVNCTFTANQGMWRGGGVFNASGSLSVANCILWGNGRQFRSAYDEWAQASSDSDLLLAYCCVQDWTGSIPGQCCLGGDPLFADAAGADGAVGTWDDDLRLRDGSPCIDAGDAAAVPAGVSTDLQGRPRFHNAVDMGAYEFDAAD